MKTINILTLFILLFGYSFQVFSYDCIQVQQLTVGNEIDNVTECQAITTKKVNGSWSLKSMFAVRRKISKLTLITDVCNDQIISQQMGNTIKIKPISFQETINGLISEETINDTHLPAILDLCNLERSLYI